MGDLGGATAATVIDANGLAVAPGFINMLSWSTESLLVDGRAQGGIRQGVTTEIMGEGSSMGPLNAEMKRRALDTQTHLKFDIPWTTLAEYLRHLEARGISPNVASFIGATTLREHVIGLENKPATPEQLDRMRELVRQRNGSGRARHRLVADLRARLLRVDRGADRTVQGGREVSGEIHLAHAQRRRAADRKRSTSCCASAARRTFRRRSIT